METKDKDYCKVIDRNFDTQLLVQPNFNYGSMIA